MKNWKLVVVMAMCCMLTLGTAAAEETAVAAGSIDLTPLIEAVIALLGMLITGRLIPWIKAKTTAQQQVNLTAAVRTFVYGAEQAFGAGHGAEKLQYACAALTKAGYDVDSTAVLATIESEVKRMQAGWEPPEQDISPEQDGVE